MRMTRTWGNDLQSEVLHFFYRLNTLLCLCIHFDSLSPSFCLFISRDLATSFLHIRVLVETVLKFEVSRKGNNGWAVYGTRSASATLRLFNRAVLFIRFPWMMFARPHLRAHLFSYILFPTPYNE